MNQIEYQSYEQQDEFRPYKVPDLTGQIDRESGRQSKAEDAYAAGLARNNKTNQINALAQTEDLRSLADFSKTIGMLVEEETKRKTEADMLEGMMMAYNEGLPQDEVDAFRESEQELRDTNTQAELASDEITLATGSPLVGQEVRNLSGWRAYGFARGRVQMAAQNFGAYYQGAKESASITIDGEVITFDTPGLTSSQYAALQQEVISGFMGNFAGVNPALLNEYLFPQVSRYAAGETATWAAERADEIETERKEQRMDDFIVDAQAGNPSAASNYILNHPDGPRKGKAELAEMLSDGLKNGTIDPDLVEEMLDTEITFNDGSVGTLAERDPRVFGGLSQEIDDTRDNNLTRDERELRREERQFMNDVKELANSGKVFTPAEIQGLEDWYIGNSLPIPPYITNLTTAQTLDDTDTTRRLDAIIADRGYLYEQELESASPAVRAQYQQSVAAGQAVAAISSNDWKDANAAIDTSLNNIFEIKDPDLINSTSYRAAQRQLRRDYEAFYAEGFIKYNDADQAHEYAIKSVERQITASPDTYLEMESGGKLDEDRPRQADQAREAVLSNTDGDGNLRPEFIIPSSTAARRQAYEFIVNGKGSMPNLYNDIARGQGFTPYDLAIQQLKADNTNFDLSQLPKPAETGLSPEVQDLLTRYPSDSTTSRAVIESTVEGGKADFFLDSVAGYESEAYGGYDAMNTGGSGWGTSNTAYGSANSGDVFDRPLSQMTLGEVMELQRTERVFAAGRYQFIPDTLAQTAQELGLTPDTPFNAETQDALAIGRLRWRLGVDNSLNGLQTEWQGLFHMPPGEAQRLLEVARTLIAQGKIVPSPYNEPQNLVQGLLTD